MRGSEVKILPRITVCKCLRQNLNPDSLTPWPLIQRPPQPVLHQTSRFFGRLIICLPCKPIRLWFTLGLFEEKLRSVYRKGRKGLSCPNMHSHLGATQGLGLIEHALLEKAVHRVASGIWCLPGKWGFRNGFWEWEAVGAPPHPPNLVAYQIVDVSLFTNGLSLKSSS